MASGTSTPIHQLAQISQDAKKCRWYLERGQGDPIKKLLQSSTGEYRRLLFWTTELHDCLHEAINHANFGLLEFLVLSCEALMEATDSGGRTPLYQAVSRPWVEGAMFLLQHGASIHNADESLSKASCWYPPFVHAVVATGNEKLIREVIRRGADMSALNFVGQNCLEAELRVEIPTGLMKHIQEEMKKANPLQEESIPEKVVKGEVVLERSVYSCKDTALVEGLIADQHSQDSKKTILLQGAWHVTKGDYARAFDCWHQPLGSGVDGSFESEWAETLLVNDRRLLEEGNLSPDIKLNYNTFGLLVISRYAPAGKTLLMPILGILFRLRHPRTVATAIGVMKHLTAVRVLHKFEAKYLVDELYLKCFNLPTASEIPFSLLVDSVTIASRCLSIVSTDRGPSTRHDLSSGFCCCGLCVAMNTLIWAVLRILKIYHQGISASEKQLQCFFSHIKDFVSTFPWIRGENIFHYIRYKNNASIFTASSIKTLVALSAEARGTNRHENMPSHLSSDKNGNTPLHICARVLSGKDLVEKGVLQCFLDNGAHLCIQNNQGESVRDILVRRGLFTEAELLPSLQCLAAAAFMKNATLRGIVHFCGPKRVRHILLDH